MNRTRKRTDQHALPKSPRHLAQRRAAGRETASQPLSRNETIPNEAMTTVYAIQHDRCETLGILGGVLSAAKISVRPVRPFRGERIPSRLDQCAGLIVMGGPMGVYEQDVYPFLRQEIRLIERALSEDIPILGICLGSQLLAAALGAAITRGPRKEIGWSPVTLSRAAASDPLWKGLDASFVAYHWHGDIFSLPRDSASLAWSSLTDCQAFRYGSSAYGILFHMEIMRKTIAGMIRSFRRELEEARVTPLEILGGAAQHLENLHRIGTTAFQRWAQTAKGRTHSAAEEFPIQIKRVYEPPAAEDGVRFLVDRLWPRGLKKDALRLDGWLKDAAPSHALRHWYAHDPVKWPEFRRRYFAELDPHSSAWEPVLEAAQRGPVSLLFSATNTDRNNAVALREYLESRRKK